MKRTRLALNPFCRRSGAIRSRSCGGSGGVRLLIWAKSGVPQTAMSAARCRAGAFALGKWCRPQSAIGAANGSVSHLSRESSAGRRGPRGRRGIDGALCLAPWRGFTGSEEQGQSRREALGSDGAVTRTIAATQRHWRKSRACPADANRNEARHRPVALVHAAVRAP